MHSLERVHGGDQLRLGSRDVIVEQHVADLHAVDRNLRDDRHGGLIDGLGRHGDCARRGAARVLNHEGVAGGLRRRETLVQRVETRLVVRVDRIHSIDRQDGCTARQIDSERRGRRL